MLAVLQGAPVILNYKVLIHESDGATEGLRSLHGVDRMISDLRTKLPFLFKHLVGPLATFLALIPIRCLERVQKFQLKKSIISGDKHAEMIATLEQVEFAGLRNNRSPDLKAAYMKIGTGTSESLKEKHIQIEFLEYLAAVGLLEKFR